MSDDQPRPFRVDVDVDPGERGQFRSEMSETYLGDPVEVPVTVTNGGGTGRGSV